MLTVFFFLGLTTVSVPSLYFKDLTLPVFLVSGTMAGRIFALTDASVSGKRAAAPCFSFCFLLVKIIIFNMYHSVF
jgi:hypothetical protein